MSLYLQCPRCSATIEAVDSAAGTVIRCPECGQRIFLRSCSAASENSTQADGEQRPAISAYWRNPLVLAGIAGIVSLLILIVFLLHSDSARTSGSDSAHSEFNAAQSPSRQADYNGATASAEKEPWNQGRGNGRASSRQSGPLGRADEPRSAGPLQSRDVAWTRISYRKLINMDQLGASGETIGDLLAMVSRQPERRAELQPFLDPFSGLLVHALDMISKPPDRPRYSISDIFQPGSEQPVWAAILRGGRIVVLDDGAGNITVFVPGDDARKAYDATYGVLRHVLEALVSEDRGPLAVSVYAYRNRYAECELALNLQPFAFESKRFPPPTDKVPLDLVGLSSFFSHSPVLEGGRIEQDGRLTLLGRAGTPQELAGTPLSLADLAVAYRAVFHAGYNEAFVSLDPHRDPTKVTVNFGGHLEDTRLGHVVLEADKRFKTITSGFDPDSLRDIRSTVRQHVPEFVPVVERELCWVADEKSGWKGTRFWYYPDSVEVDASLDYSVAAIRVARFSADAERSRHDYATSGEFQRLKKDELSPCIKANIAQLNTHYDAYARAFRELSELDVVARIMGICVWLKKANCSRLDLDSLLGITLPECRTPREREQLLSSGQLATVSDTVLSLSGVRERAVLANHNPLLNRRMQEAFPSAEQLAEFLAMAEAGGGDTRNTKAFLGRARQLLLSHGDQPVRTVVTSERQLEALLEWATEQQSVPLPPQIAALAADIERGGQLCDDLENQMKNLQAVINRSLADHNRNVARYNQLIDEYKRAVEQVNASINRYNAARDHGLSVVMEITGGIGLEPDRFAVRRTGKTPAIGRIEAVLGQLGNESGVVGGERWIRTRPYVLGSSVERVSLARPSGQVESHRTPTGVRITEVVTHQDHYWQSVEPNGGGWHDQSNIGESRTTERLYDAGRRVLQVAEYQEGRLESLITGRMSETGEIVFERSGRTSVLAPQTPPPWWPSSRN